MPKYVASSRGGIGIQPGTWTDWNGGFQMHTLTTCPRSRAFRRARPWPTMPTRPIGRRRLDELERRYLNGARLAFAIDRLIDDALDPRSAEPNQAR